MKPLASELNNLFRRNVAARLAEYGWTQVDLADEMSVTQGYVSQILSGHRGAGLDTVEKFAKALQIKPSELISENSHVLS